MHLVIDPEDEDPEEKDPSEDPMDDEDHAEAEQVLECELEPLIPRGTRMIVISTQLRIIRTTVDAKGRLRGDGASTLRAPPLTPEDRATIRE